MLFLSRFQWLLIWAVLPIALLFLPARKSPAQAQPVVRASLEGHTDTLTCLAYSPDGKTLASGSKDGTVRLLEHRDEQASRWPPCPVTRKW